ncbi:hypothetical protein [Neorhodopirellula pilleata]|nr:hypothetical protein [Neorhodopirellula pilleata]
MVQQHWMRKPGLYGTRNQSSSNHQAVLQAFRCVALNAGNRDAHTVAETHILASLLSASRSNGAQRIFPDASLKLRDRTERSHRQALDEMLNLSANQRMTLHEFDVQNRQALGFPEYEEEVWARYEEFSAQLFDQAIPVWRDDLGASIACVHSQWDRMNKSFGRRRGCEDEKQILDILSFESKAAFHQCYSALWCELIPHLAAEQNDQAFFNSFHALWHLEQRVPCEPHPKHLLHGLVLGLHPAFGDLLSTNAGKRVVCHILESPTNKEAQERFLHAGLVSLHHYAAQRECR